jgi:uncharacterized protein YkwD
MVLGVIAPNVIQSSRRRLVAWLAALPAAPGLVLFADSDAADARKGRRKKRKRRSRKKGKGGGGSGGYSPDDEERAFLDLINDYRSANKRPPLSLHDQLGVAAERHSQDQANRDRGGHTGSDGSDAGQRITRAGYDWRFWGENVFWSKPDGSAQAAFAWWKNSPDHNANMLSPNFTEIGIGRARSNSGWWYWTTDFGDR